MTKDKKDKNSPDSEAGSASSTSGAATGVATNSARPLTPLADQGGERNSVTSRPQVIESNRFLRGSKSYNRRLRFLDLSAGLFRTPYKGNNKDNYDKFIYTIELISRVSNLIKGTEQVQSNKIICKSMVMTKKALDYYIGKTLITCCLRKLYEIVNILNNNFKITVEYKHFIIKVTVTIEPVDGDDSTAAQVAAEQKKLEEEEDELLNRDSDGEYESLSDGRDDTIISGGGDRFFIPDADVVSAGGSSRPPPVIDLQALSRIRVEAGRRSSLSVTDEVDLDVTDNKTGKTKKGGKGAKGAKGKGKETKQASNKDEPRLNGDTGNKRKNDKQGDTEVEAKKKKSNKKSFAEVLKEGGRMCDIRSDSGEPLTQEDYDFLAAKLMYALMKVQEEQGRDRALWRPIGSGLSQNAVWVGVRGETCVEFMRKAVPGIKRPDLDGKKFRYVFYGPGECPMRYIRWRIPYMWTKVPVQDLDKMMKACNDELWESIPQHNGEYRDPKIRVIKRVFDNQDNVPEDGRGYVTFLVEVEEDAIRVIVEKCLGVWRIGATEGRLMGANIVRQVRIFLGVEVDEEDQDDPMDQNEDETKDPTEDNDNK